MDLEILPYVLIMYLFLNGILVFPLLILGYMRYTSASNQEDKNIGLTALIAPLVGFLLYVTVDVFEKYSLGMVWWLGMLFVLGVPLYRVIKSLYGQKKTTNTKAAKTVKAKKTSTKKPTKKK